ncbi:MAG: LysM peptidoglycan-binding domain-containing protein, partial [Verrucomicrobiae bacterium]|nr:LysM peptidoglycan-binding domain-containing protein [Verrucomicrobiae bacterium]
PVMGMDVIPPEQLRPATYEVRKGDVIVKIATRFDMTAAQLMQFNELSSDLIHIGDILRIPSAGELMAMVPPPVAVPVDETGADAGKPTGRPGLELPPTTVEELELQTVLFQVFLDREMFTQGGIDGDFGPGFDRLRDRYLELHPYISDRHDLKERALAAVGDPFTSYKLRREDFRFIGWRKAPPRDVEISTNLLISTNGNGVEGVGLVVPARRDVYQEMVASGFLSYADAWEFVAERFHCDEDFLRRINPHLDDQPVVNAVFKVPNVIPFEIENAFDAALQPEADPHKPVTATVLGLSRLEVKQGGQIVASMPLASVRPGLRGRGTWQVRDVVPRPRMLTRHVPREAPEDPGDDGRPAEFLPSGPNNPAGVAWIRLAKDARGPALRYGLHGTGIPARLEVEGIGGFRMSNWDIVRIARLLPAGTPLEWKAK